LADGVSGWRSAGSECPSSLDELHARYSRSRDPALRERLLALHAPLARVLATRFGVRGHQSRDDVLQVAYLGLIKALERFDPDRGFTFSTYATRTIVGELKRNLRDHGWAVRPSRSIHDRYLALESWVDQLTHELGRAPTVRELAARAGMPTEEVIEAREAINVRHAQSFDALSDAGQPLVDAVGCPDAAFEWVEQQMTVDQLLARLTTMSGGWSSFAFSRG
jgi:RNA polymerase sigma-B factor